MFMSTYMGTTTITYMCTPCTRTLTLSQKRAPTGIISQNASMKEPSIKAWGEVGVSLTDCNSNSSSFIYYQYNLGK